MNVVVFSKDRACQLELFLRSAKKYFKEYDDLKWNILYTYSDEEFGNGYKKLFQINQDFNLNFVKQNDFKSDLLNLIDKNNDISVFFVDDIVWKNEFSIENKEFKYFLSDDDVLTLSLRLHTNLSYCYPARIPMHTPKYDSENMTFRWRGQSGDYGYPMSLDGHFFRTKEILPHLKTLNYNNPNSLESAMSFYPLPKHKMGFFEESKIMNVPINKVQTFNQNIHGNIPADLLNTKFLEGYIIDLEPFDGFKNISCHQEMKLRLKKYKKNE